MSPVLIARDTGCTGNCRQGRACTCAPLVTRNGGQQIDTEQMRKTGAIEGPYRRTRPLTLSLWQRIKRAVAGFSARHVIDPVVRD